MDSYICDGVELWAEPAGGEDQSKATLRPEEGQAPEGDRR
jgi:hypothetical protein